ncbi:unnamed protein product [Tetraodon nigroviridis]|uniref:(spotted green pufferfish) hypothetical protein n=1 Tax=Tetraodon nigroviridis TaxID=99883 RepID=Q4T420_TETNG|nr:unnamed protein product [Tetraodon nigroviridis]
MAGEKGPTKRSAMDIKRLASLIQRGAGRLLVIDSRTFSEYNASHVQGAINVCCSKLRRLGKRRAQSVLQECAAIFRLFTADAVSPAGSHTNTVPLSSDLVSATAEVELGRKHEVVVYDQNSKKKRGICPKTASCTFSWESWRAPSTESPCSPVM